MKKLLFLALVLCFALSSCDDKEGDWDPIKTDKSSIEFTSAGGTDVVTAKNYNTWWVEGVTYIQGTDTVYKYGNYTADEEETFEETKSGISSWLSYNTSGNKLTVTADKNTSPLSRKALLSMTVGDSFCTITVSQKGK